MTYKITTYPNENLCFVDFTDGENNASFKGWLCKDNTILLESFRTGNIGNYKFSVFDDSTDTFFFKGSGKGKKPQTAIDSMTKLIDECNKTELKLKTV